MNLKDTAVVKLKISGFPKESEYNSMPFGRQIEYRHKLAAFKESANVSWLSQKRKSYTKAIREFCKLNNVKEYYCRFHASPNYYDDTFEIYWK